MSIGYMPRNLAYALALGLTTGIGLAFVLSYLIERGRPAEPDEEPRSPPP